MLNPHPPTAPKPYDWADLDNAFNQVSVWNMQNPARAPKAIQLVVLPGFNSPPWMLAKLPSCDGLFQSPVETPSSPCGKATFTGYVQGGGTRELPMPWAPFYKSSWRTFLSVLAARYGSNPAFVSIAVAGPTASSEEMMLPANGNTPRQAKFGDILPNDVWLRLLAFHYADMPAYENTDQAFIDEWNAAIDLYGEVFSGVTLVAPMTAAGLPDLSTNFTIPAAFAGYCASPDMHCAVATTVLSHFVESTVGGANAKADQEDGMDASRHNINLGVPGVKMLSQSTAQLTSPSTQILGGSQFTKSFATFTLAEGCTSAFPPNSSDKPAGCDLPPSCTKEACVPGACIPQACLAPGVTPEDVAKYKRFSKIPPTDLIPRSRRNTTCCMPTSTAAAASSFDGTPGSAPLNYLQIYSPDILYANDHASAPAQIVQSGGGSVMMSAQDLLNLASQKLQKIAEP